MCVYIVSTHKDGMTLDILISNKCSTPIYEQIKEQIKSEIMNGNLTAGEPLPSIRQLAKSLHVSVITTQRAYEDLLAEGYIETTAGKGSFVAQRSNELVRDEQYRMIEIHLEEATLIAHKCGIKFDKLVELLGLFFDGGN